MRENMVEEEKNQFAVLIDADNISPKYAPIIFQELEAYGFPSCRRIYGNWSKANGWNESIPLFLYSSSLTLQVRMQQIWQWLLMQWTYYMGRKWMDFAW